MQNPARVLFHPFYGSINIVQCRTLHHHRHPRTQGQGQDVANHFTTGNGLTWGTCTPSMKEVTGLGQLLHGKGFLICCHSNRISDLTIQ